MSLGFYKRRRGILEHLEAGTIGFIDLAVHDYLCLKINAVRGSECSIPAGVCFTSSVAISSISSKEVSERTIRRSLEHLEKIGWIKRWAVPGKHGNYPVLLARAAVHDLSGKEYRVNAEATTDWRFPVYVFGEETARSCPGGVRELSTDREKREKKKEKKNPAAKPAPPADPRFQPFFTFAFESFTVEHERKPLWGGKDYAGLKNLLKGQSPETLSLERLKNLWQNFLASTEAFTAKQGGSLAYFCSNVDKFADGPILATPQKGGSNGKPTATDLAIRNARALGLDRRLN
jgi:hypothetical protein